MPFPAPAPFSQASENNKFPILDVLKHHLNNRRSLLEIGGGTGQHAAFFARQFPEIIWQSSDIHSNVKTLNLRVASAKLKNLPLATSLDVNKETWNYGFYDAIFSANCLHIISEDSVINFFKGTSKHINDGGVLLVYGPFKYRGKFTTESNAGFDRWLKARDPKSGIRDFEWTNELAEEVGFSLVEDNAMPANNQLLAWAKIKIEAS
ncbi:MAG: class I SAM-dependent methyltransferase [Gammaproteobacteria bacterium]|nr:class I SAM-dependent methyltransferase [Gammaproteobacteria bacterium]